MNATMPLDIADRIYAEVLTASYRRHRLGVDVRRHNPALLRSCPCWRGPCVSCWAGSCDRCVVSVGSMPAATIATSEGRMAGTWNPETNRSRDAEVWLTGAPCVARCGCGCRLPIGQLELFALAGGAR